MPFQIALLLTGQDSHTVRHFVSKLLLSDLDEHDENRGILRTFYFVILPNLSHPDPPWERSLFSTTLTRDEWSWMLLGSWLFCCFNLLLCSAIFLSGTCREMHFAGEFFFVVS